MCQIFANTVGRICKLNLTLRRNYFFMKGGRLASPPSFSLTALGTLGEHELWPHIGYEGINVASARPAMTQVIGRRALQTKDKIAE